MRPVLLALFLGVIAVAAAACEKPDASYVTSPSMKTLIGTTVGAVTFHPEDSPPEPKDPPPDWLVDFNLARWATLENDSPSLEVLMQVKTQPGAGFELWIVSPQGTVARWSAGSTTTYVGTACFQLELQVDGERLPLGSGVHRAVIVFRSPDGAVIASRWIDITHNVPNLKGDEPGAASDVIRDAWACRRGQ